MLASSFHFVGAGPNTTVEREAGISSWPRRRSAGVVARVVDADSRPGLVITGLTVYDRVDIPREQLPRKSPLQSRLVAVAWSDGRTGVAVSEGQALGVRVRFSGFSGVTGTLHSVIQILADGQEVIDGLGATVTNKFPVPQPVPGPPLFQTINWVQANPWGIQMAPVNPPADPMAGPWWAGHVECALVLAPPAGSLLAGTNGGGVWLLGTPNEYGTVQGQPLTDDWEDTPFINALCQGPGDPQHVYAAAWGLKRGSLRETAIPVAGGPRSIYKWNEIALPAALASLSTAAYAPAVTQIAVTSTAPRRIVIASTAGLYWAEIPAPGGPYLWNQVTTMANGSPFPSGAYLGLTVGAQDRIITAATGLGIFWGDWSGAGLLMNAATLPFAPAAMQRTSLAAATAAAGVAYAVAAAGDNSMLGVLQSGDNGQTWAATSATMGPTGPSTKTLPQVAGLQGYYNNTIAVSPLDSNVVAVGWQYGHFVSRDGGQTFSAFQSGQGLHNDVHCLYYDPWSSTEMLYICSDGGICSTNDGGTTFNSSYNQTLANLQCYATYVTRDFYGTLDATDQFLATGLQDNGNVYCILPPFSDAPPNHVQLPVTVPGSDVTPWMQAGGGDGGCVTLLAQQICFNSMGSTTVAAMISSEFPPTSALTSTAVGLSPGTPNVVGPGVVRVLDPATTNTKGDLMYAVATAGSLTVFGLFGNASGSPLYWQAVGSINSSESGDSISALAPMTDGSQVLVATTRGLAGILQLTLTPTGPVIAAAIPLNVGLAPAGVVTRIVFAAPDVAYAAYNWANGGIILKYEGLSWTPTAGQPPVGNYFNDGIYGLAVNNGLTIRGFGLGASTPPLIFVGANDAVYVSRDLGATWQNASWGLPACPQGADIQCADAPVGNSYDFTGDPIGPFAGLVVYLGTWGRSVWMASSVYVVETP